MSDVQQSPGDAEARPSLPEQIAWVEMMIHIYTSSPAEQSRSAQWTAARDEARARAVLDTLREVDAGGGRDR